MLQLPRAVVSKNKIKPQTITWKGLNRNKLVSDNELSACKNLSFKHSPVLSARAPRETLYTLASPKALFSVGSKLAWVDGTSFKHDNIAEGAVSASAKSMVDFNGKIIIMPDKKYYDYGADTFGDIGSGVYPNPGSVPDIDFICVHMNRIFGFKGNDAYSTGLGEYNDWTTFDAVSTDAWATDVASEAGSFTGCVAYSNHVVVFKAGMMFELYGNVPSNFNLLPVNKVGCIGQRAICEVNSILYFANQRGIHAYAGGQPRNISYNLNETIVDAILGTDGRYLYASIYNGTGWKLYVLDTGETPTKGLWIQEDDLHVIEFTRIGEYCYALASDGKLYKFNSGTEHINWELETKPFTDELFEKKGHSRICIRANLETDSTMNVYVKCDNGSYMPVKSVNSSGLRKFFASTRVQFADHFQVKITGAGDFDLYSFQREFVIGGE